MIKEGTKTISASEKTRIREYLEEQNLKTEAWVAEDPENRWAGLAAVDYIIEDLNKYLCEGETPILSLEDYLCYQEWLNYYEGYKGVHGIKARWTHWTDHTLEEWEAKNRGLAEEYKAEQERYREARIERKLAKIRRKKEEELHRQIVLNILTTEVTIFNTVLA